MDTDELTEEAYRVLIIESGKISEFLQAEIGARARHYKSEESYLDAIHKDICYLVDHPQEFLDKWVPLHETDRRQFSSHLRRLAVKIHMVRNIPIEDRGPTGDSECE